ncbi:MAG: hypothetical protein JWP61_465, partial [Friedmanniella sp.]|nr:hypothetical protein [Friedmanniella sp.]
MSSDTRVDAAGAPASAAEYPSTIAVADVEDLGDAED